LSQRRDRSGRRKVIGRYPVITLGQAREKAKTILAERTLGKHRPNNISWKNALVLFLTEVEGSTRPRTFKEHMRALKRYFPFGDTKLPDITKQDVMAKLARLKNTPSQQKHAAVYIKIFFNWAIDEGYLETNPIASFKQGKAKRRKRVLTDDELFAIWNAAGEIGGLFGGIVRLILLTGQRRGEIAGLLDTFYSHNQHTVILPGTLTKNHLEHTFPVGPLAIEIINERVRAPERWGHFLFPCRTSDEKPFNGWSKSKRELDKIARIAPWTLHDLRRTFRTGLGRLGVRPDIAERLVNHVSARSEMEETNDLYTYLPEMREAMEKWDSHIARIARGDGLLSELISPANPHQASDPSGSHCLRSHRKCSCR